MNDSIVSDSMAYAKLYDVEMWATKLGQAEILLEQGYAEFCEILQEVQDHRYWQYWIIDDVPCESWGQYMEDITKKHRMGRAQLYHKLAVCRQLKGVVASKDLTEMGIAKASVLADVHRATGLLPEGAVAQAKDAEVTTKELKQSVQSAAHMPEQENGEWLDLGMAFYVTAEEKATLQDAMAAARNHDPVISNTLKDFQQRKEIALRWAQEFLNTYDTPAAEDDLSVYYDADPGTLGP